MLRLNVAIEKGKAQMAKDKKNIGFDKSKLPSRHTTIGPERAPHRSYLYAMGVTEAEVYQPLVGVATSWNEAAPCNISLGRQAQAVKRGGENRRRHAPRVHDHHRN